MPSCEGCKYENWSGYDWPCTDCNRIERDDMYESDSEEEVTE